MLETLSIKPKLWDVGKTSWKVHFEVLDGSHRIAEVLTTMVATNATHDESVVLPHARELKKMIPPKLEGNNCNRIVPTATFVSPPVHCRALWKSAVRVTDCDSLNHINNAVYPLLCEEARAYGAIKRLYDTPAAIAMALQPSTYCHINYIGQARPFQRLHIFSHIVGDSSFHFKVEANGATVAEVVLGVEAPSGHSDQGPSQSRL